MLRYKLRTLLIVLALGPAIVAAGWRGWRESREWRERERLRAIFVPISVEIVEIQTK